MEGKRQWRPRASRMLGLTHHVADILPTALKGMRLPLIVDANKEGLSPPGCGTAIVVDLLVLTVLLLLLLHLER